MEMLVTKFSKGKYRNEGELFSEPISRQAHGRDDRVTGAAYRKTVRSESGG